MESINHLKFQFELPTIWRHEIGIAESIGEVLNEFGCCNPLLMTDKLLVDRGIIEPVVFSLEKSGISYTVCDAVRSEPTTGLLESISDDLDLASFDSVIAVGGGSVIDVSKGLAVLGSFEGSVSDYYGPEKIISKPSMKIFRKMDFIGGDENNDEAIKTGCEKLNLLLGRLGLLVRLRDLGYRESHMENIVTEVLDSIQIRTNPRQPSREEVKEVYRSII